MNQDGYIYKNSFLHRMNPSLKFIMVILFIVIIFLPYGFIYQFFLLGILLIAYFMAKLPIKRLLKIFVSILIMAAILLLINWITYKSPGLVFDLGSKGFIAHQDWESSKYCTTINGIKFVQGTLWGSNPVTNANSIFENILGLNVSGSSQGFYIVNGINNNSTLNSINDVFSKNNTRIEYQNVDSDTYYFYVFTKNTWSLSSYAITYMIYVSMKVLLTIICVILLTSTTSSIELTSALEDILYPLKFLRLPVNQMAMIIALSIRFIPSLLDESTRVLRAQASRGIDFKNGKFNDKIKSLVSLVVPLFSISFRKAEELSNAMEARGYNPEKERTRYRVFSIKFIDWLLLAFVSFLLGMTIVLSVINGKTILTETWVYDCIQMLN